MVDEEEEASMGNMPSFKFGESKADSQQPATDSKPVAESSLGPRNGDEAVGIESGNEVVISQLGGESELAAGKEGGVEDVSGKHDSLQTESVPESNKSPLVSESKLAAGQGEDGSDAVREKDEIRREEEIGNVSEFRKTESVVELSDLQLRSELELTTAPKEEDNLVKNVGEGREEANDEISTPKMSDDGEGNFGGSQLVDMVEHGGVEHDEHMEDGVGKKAEEDSREEHLDNAMEEKQEIDSEVGKEDEKNKDMISPKPDNLTLMSELEGHNKDENLAEGNDKDEKDESLAELEWGDLSILSATGVIRKGEREDDASAMDDLTGVSESKVNNSEEKDQEMIGPALDDSTLFSESNEREVKAEDLTEPILDNSKLFSESEVDKKEEKDEDMIEPKLDDLTVISKANSCKSGEKDQEDDSTLVTESKVDAREDKDEDMIAKEEEEELPASVTERDNSMLGGESDPVAKEDDLDEDVVAEEKKGEQEGEGEGEGEGNGEEEAPSTDMGIEPEVEVPEVGRGVGKRKRGRATGGVGRPQARKNTEEDVCFICFDGGDLVLCDRRGCPKAYHPSCVNRDEAFFQTKGRWNCGICTGERSFRGWNVLKNATLIGVLLSFSRW